MHSIAQSQHPIMFMYTIQYDFYIFTIKIGYVIEVTEILMQCIATVIWQNIPWPLYTCEI